jgi:hypothetical protein
MKTIITSNSSQACRALCTLLIGIAALWAIPRGARAQLLYVGQVYSGSVSAYDATTGTADPNFSTISESFPYPLAVSGNDLFTGSYGGSTPGSIGEYNATTGALINPNFIEGITSPEGLAISGNTLFVASAGPSDLGQIGTYSATTGAAISPDLIPSLGGRGSFGLGVLGNNLFVALYAASSIDGGCKHHTLDASIARSFEHTQRAIARRPNQFIVVLGID